MPEAVLHISSLAGSPLLDSSGGRLGRVQDLIARLDPGDALPPITGLKAKIGGREMFVPANRIATLEPEAARTSTTELNLGRFERRPHEVLLAGDLLGRSLINVQTAHLVRAREVELVCDDGTWRVAGIDASLVAGLRRLLPRRLRSRETDRAEFVAWPDLEALVSHVPTSRLRLAPRRIARLHPAQIADLVEAASHEEGEEILQAVGQDKELEADVFEELDDEHQIEFLRERSDPQVAAVLSRMASDDAADLLLELEQDRRLPILNLLPAAKQRKIRGLLGHNPQTAGGIMNPDFVSVPEGATVAEAIAAVRSTDLPTAQVSCVYSLNGSGCLVGATPLADLIRAPESQALSELADSPPPIVGVDADLPEIARLMSDYNLISLPVADGEGRMAGVLSVDDVLELTLPADWRRRHGVARD